MRKKMFTVLGLVVTTLALQSCFDSDYDLDNIDKTIAIGSSNDTIWLPTSSTGDIEIGNFLKVKDGDYIKILKDASGKEFYCAQASGSDVMQVTIPAYAPAGSELTFSSLSSSPIDLTSKPKSLDDLVLDLNNPMILFDIENKAPVTIDCTISFDCTTGGVKTSDAIQLSKFTVNKATGSSSSKSYFCFSDNVEKSTWQSDEGTTYNWQTSTNLQSTLTHIPDQVQMVMKEIKMTSATTSPTTITKDIDAKFSLYAPLCAGPNFEFTNESDEKGLYSEMKIDDDMNIDIKSIHLRADIVNDMPLDILLDAIAVDDAGKTIANIKPLNSNPKKALAGKTTAITLDLHTTDGSNITKYLKEDATVKLDGVKLTIKATGNATSSTTPLRPTDKLKIKNMRIGVAGSIVIDAN